MRNRPGRMEEDTFRAEIPKIWQNIQKPTYKISLITKNYFATLQNSHPVI